MDVLQDYLPLAYDLYNTYYTPYARYLAPLHASFLHYQSLFFRYIYPSLYPFYRLTTYLLNRALSSILTSTGSSSSSSSSPTTELPTLLISTLSVAILLFLSLRILNFVRRQLMWWIGLATTLGTWFGMAALGWYVYNRGVEESLEDAAWLVGLLLGWSEEGGAKGGRMASEREWDAERMRRTAGRAGARAGKGHSSYKRSRGAGW